MIDLRAARSDPERFRARVARKGAAHAFDELLAADSQWRDLVPKVDELRGRQKLKGQLAPEQVEELTGEAEVRALFRSSRLGVIAGCHVTSGAIRRNSRIRVVREGAVVYDTGIASLKRFKDDVREVQEGFECGILLDGFNDVKEDDVLEAYETREIERTDLEVTEGGAPAAVAEPEAEPAES